MSNTLKRYLFVVIFYLLVGCFSFFNDNNSQILLFIFICGVITIILLKLLYPKRGVFLYALIGTITGIYAADMFYNILISINNEIFLPIYKPYFDLIFAYLGFILTFSATQKHGSNLFSQLSQSSDIKSMDIKILDTSVIIDGRITGIIETGFISGTLILPKFVLNEIQSLADSKDPIKRSRARRGLDILNKIKELTHAELKIYSKDYPEIKGVDAKLIALAKELSGAIVTTDYNLNKIAKLDNIPILNINDLANTLKVVFLPGEEFDLDIIREGKEERQGIGYLEDGTMVVVANGIDYIGKKVHVKVTTVLQTSAGRIVFTEIVKK